jgi:exodeoxyribonuclease-5
MPGDWAERAAALTELNRSMLVEAGAGTRKTSIMAGRAVMLMAAGVPPAEIVAVSYTEFSASELRDRITRFTAAVASGRPPADLLPGLPGGTATAQQVANLERAANHLDRMSCTTIHGFCRSLLMPYPVEAAIDPGAAVLDQGAADLLFEDVRKDWLRRRLAGP